MSKVRPITQTITYNEGILEVKGMYTPKHEGDTYNDPDFKATFESFEIYYKGVDIRPILNAENCIEIEEKCLMLINSN